jgi:hypothetical protein
MATQPQMNPRLQARLQGKAQPFLEPDEHVIHGANNMTMPAWIYAFFVGILLLPYVIQKNSMVVMTERNVYVIKLGLTNAKEVLFKAPLGSYRAQIGGSAFPGRYLLVADQKIWLPANSRIQASAHAIVAAAGNGAPSGAEAAGPGGAGGPDGPASA